MALHFSANQYEKEFHPKRLQNWEVSKVHRARPRSQEGFTQIIATDRGHLKPGVSRSLENPWGNFVGTWDQKCHVLGNNASNPTARNNKAIAKYTQMVQDGDDARMVKTPVNHKIDMSKKASEAEMAGVKDSPGNRSGARTPDLRDLSDLRDQPTDSPIPRPSAAAIMTPTYEQVTARHTDEKACSPIDRYPSPKLNTPPPATGMSEGIGSSYPDGHHFKAY
ncbi:protein Flattop homolog isoform X2 [Lineus longissimus]|uniref:protein Flattop homolog isoform X2 n=1 Tax=Lineus longissimus TaxID=88925 RepID=UPI002B4F493A